MLMQEHNESVVLSKMNSPDIALNMQNAGRSQKGVIEYEALS
ncbi:hypothetical protein FLA_3441 [Filimonas lacunae]|nr:hypothetical protein FLA_3441 [Filimonas lacunae]